jgi:hypothetical protein
MKHLLVITAVTAVLFTGVNTASASARGGATLLMELGKKKADKPAPVLVGGSSTYAPPKGSAKGGASLLMNHPNKAPVSTTPLVVGVGGWRPTVEPGSARGGAIKLMERSEPVNVDRSAVASSDRR